MKLVWKIALGIILASAILSLCGLVATAGVAWWANQQIERELSEQRERQAERERVAAETRRMEAERERLAAIREQRAREAKLDGERKRNQLEKAFADQYQPPPGCARPQSNSRWVECVDIRRKAKAEFIGQQALFSATHKAIRIGE